MSESTKVRLVVAVSLAAMLLAAICIVAVGSSDAQGSVSGFCGETRVVTPNSSIIATGAAYASLTVGNTPVSPTLPTFTTPGIRLVGALVLIKNNPVNIRVDGGAPTVDAGLTFGTSQPGGAAFVSCGTDLRNLQLVAASATTGNALAEFNFFIPGQ